MESGRGYAGHVALKGCKIACEFVVVNSKGNEPLWRRRYRREDNIKMALK
jgi:hypothetical protein